MLPLLIQISNKETGAQVEAGFKRSPVRIGRNHLNDLAIDEGFVSQWHGLVRFDEAGTRFLDLGSTNGTELNGERLEKNVEIDIQPETRLAVGPLRFTFARVALRDEQVLSRRASAFQLGGTSRSTRGIAQGGTVELGGSLGSPAGGAASPDGATLADAAMVHKKQELVNMAKRQKALMDTVKPLYAAFEQAKTALDGAIEAGLAGASGSERETQTSLLSASFPNAFSKPGMSGEGPEGDGGVPEWFERLSPGSSGEWENPIMAMERAGAVLEAFAQALIDLEEGQKQIRKDLNVEAGETSLPTFTDSRQLLGYLLDGSVDGRDRIDELARSFADLAVHQLGIVNGAVDGARAILAAMSPHSIGAVSRGAMVTTSAGIGDFVWPFGKVGAYYRYAAKHLELSTQERFTTQLFGASFSRAYYRITGRRS